VIFNESPPGLYYHDMANRAILLVNTNKVNSEGYTLHKYNTTKQSCSLKVKTVRRTPDPVIADYVKIPQMILDLANDVNIGADVMFVDYLVFIFSASINIKFTTGEHSLRKTKPIITESL
jgi:hypothetical protein